MDYFAQGEKYDTDSPNYQGLIQRAQQEGLSQDGSQHPVANLSLGTTVGTISSHNTAPPQTPREPTFPSVDGSYDKKAGRAVFTFSKHSDDALRIHLVDCLLTLWESSGSVAHKLKESDSGAWELRIKADANDPRIDLCRHKIRTLRSNCQVLGYVGEKFVAAAKEIRNEKNILIALCDPSITFFRDQNGDVCAITEADEAISDCLDSLISKKEYKAAYALLASRDAVYLDSNHGPNDHHLNYTIGRMAGLRLLSSLGKPEGQLIYLLSGDLEYEMLATELLLRSLDRRPDSVEPYVLEAVAKSARTFDKSSLNDLCRKHQSAAAQLWLHKTCLRSLIRKEDYEAAYELLTGKDAVFGRGGDHGRELIHAIHESFPEILPTMVKSDSPEDHFLYALAQRCLGTTVKKDGLAMWTVELTMRSLDRRPVSIDPNVMKVVGWVAVTLEREALDGLCGSPYSVVSHSWLRRLMWSRQDSDACRNYYAASRKCRYSLGLMVQEPMKGEWLSVDEINQLQDLVLAAVMMDPTSGEFRVACEALDIVYRYASPEPAYLIFEAAMMLLEENRSVLPFDGAKHFLKGLEGYDLLRSFALGRTEALHDDDSDPIVYSDEESS